MNERALPTEGAPACPFVAFEDDRDGRSTAPDHRHRCFAEPRPAPRALAHQEAYCLASAFPVCPTFQDWARREAAAARPLAPTPSASRDDVPVSGVMPVPEPDPYPAPPDMPPEGSQRRNPPRDWAAPPPWTGEDGSEPEPAEAPGAYPAAYPAASPAAYPAPQADPPPTRDAVRQADDWATASRGLVGSAADRLAGPDPDEPAGARPAGYDDAGLDAWSKGAAGVAAAGYGASAAAAAGPASPAPVPSRNVPPPRSSNGSRTPDRGRSDRGRPPAATPQAAHPQQEPSELFGPAWERPRRYEAYPTLRTRIGLPGLGGIPRVAMAALALVLAALLLFAFGPSLLGIGRSNPGSGGGAASPTATAGASATPLATEAPAPTPTVYVVAKGDTMSKIAKKFGLSVEAIMAANPKIKNANKIKVGDKITIPLPVSDEGSSDSPAP